MIKVHLWFPALFSSKGGIQRYSLFLLEVLRHQFSQYQVSIFLKHDRLDTFKRGFSGTFPPNFQIHCSGNSPKRFRTAHFAAQLFGYGAFEKPDLVLMSHINFTPVAHKLKQIYDIPFCAIAHGIDAWDISDTRIKSALAAADQIYSVSNYTKKRLLAEQELDSHKIGLLPNTFDADQFQIQPKPDYLFKRYGLRSEQPVIFTLCRLAKAEAYKGYDQLIRSLPTIQQVIPNVHYILAGTGDDLSRIQFLIHQQGLQDSVTLAGFIPDDELVDHYNLCDVFAMPSKGEGFGIVYLEAMACGKPVLAGNQDGAVDALCYGKLGALVNPDDSEEIAQALTATLKGNYPNPLMYNPEALRKSVIEQYGFEKFQKNFLEKLQKAVC